MILTVTRSKPGTDWVSDSIQASLGLPQGNVKNCHRIA